MTESLFNGIISDPYTFTSTTVTQSTLEGALLYKGTLESTTATVSELTFAILVNGEFESSTRSDSTIDFQIFTTGQFNSITGSQSSVNGRIRTYTYDPKKYHKSEPIWIYDKNEKLQLVLSDDAVPYREGWITEQLNGEVRLSFEVVANDPSVAFIENDGRVITKDVDGNYMEFIIRIVEDFDDINGTFKLVEAEGGEYELIDEFLTEYVQASVDLETALKAVLQGTRIQVGEVDYLGEKPVSLKNMTVKQAVYELLHIFGAERRFRVEVQGNRITRRYLDALERRGGFYGKRWEDGKDIVSTNRVIDSTGIKTALYGRGVSDEEGNRLTFASVEWSKANGDPTDKPLGQTWVGDPDALTQWGNDGGTRHKFGLYDGQEEDPAELLLNTWNRLQEITKSNDTYDVGVVQLAEILDVPHEQVRLGDTSYVVNRRIYPAVESQASVIEFRHNLNDRKLSEVTLGKFRATYNLVERFHNVEKEFNESIGVIKKKPTHNEMLEKVNEALEEAQRRIDEAKRELETAMIDLDEAMQIADDVFENKIVDPQNYKGHFEGNVGITGELHVAGTIIGGSGATIRGTINAEQLNLVQANILDANIQDATITGTLNSVGGRFVGELYGATIYSQGLTFVGSDLYVTDNLHLGSAFGGAKKIIFNNFASISSSDDNITIDGTSLRLETTANGGVILEKKGYGGALEFPYTTSYTSQVFQDNNDRYRLKLQSGNNGSGATIWLDPMNGNIYFRYNGQNVHVFYGNGDYYHAGNGGA